jgi:hypothetical protein
VVSVYTLTFKTKNRIFLNKCTYVFHVSRTVYSFCYRTHCAVCEVRTKVLNMGLMSIRCFLPYRAMTGVVSHRLSPWRPGFDPGPVRARFMVDKMALGQVVLRVLRFSPVIIPPIFYTHHLNVTLNRRTNGRNLGTFKQSRAVSDIGEHWIEKYFQIISSNLQTAECPLIEGDSLLVCLFLF